MKLEVLLDIFFQLLYKRKLTAAYLSQKYALSPRTVYRYVEILEKVIPLSVKRGRNGGILLSDCYKLPLGILSETEYSATIEALSNAYAQTLDEKYLQAKRKLSAQTKPQAGYTHTIGEMGSFFIRDAFSQIPRLAEKLRLLEQSIQQRELLEIVYADEKNKRTLEPHALLQEDGVWILLAFCRKERAVRRFFVSDIACLFQTEESFSKRVLSHEEGMQKGSLQPLSYTDILLKVTPNALPRVQKRFGKECIRATDGGYLAQCTLPQTDALAYAILSLGAGVEVIFPPSLREKMSVLIKEIANPYL